MLANNEVSVGIAVSSKLSPDASIAMEGWINGFLGSRYFDGNELRHDSDGDHINKEEKAYSLTSSNPRRR